MSTTWAIRVATDAAQRIGLTLPHAPGPGGHGLARRRRAFQNSDEPSSHSRTAAASRYCSFIRAFLTPAVRKYLTEVLVLLPGREVSVHALGATLIVRKSTVAWQAADVRLFHTRVLAIALAAMKAAGGAVVESEESASARAADAICLVCGETLGDRRAASCLVCETPYHGECWAYNRGCAVYGCTGRPRAHVARDR